MCIETIICFHDHVKTVVPVFSWIPCLGPRYLFYITSWIKKIYFMSVRVSKYRKDTDENETLPYQLIDGVSGTPIWSKKFTPFFVKLSLSFIKLYEQSCINNLLCEKCIYFV